MKEAMLNQPESADDFWPSVSDLMAGLMLIFMFIAIAYMLNVQQGQQRVREIAVTYQQAQVALYEELMEEFRRDLPAWGAVLDKDTLAIAFFEPEVLFRTGSSDVTPKFRQILDDFFPRYMKILFSDRFRDHIEEIRIEGHTSSEWSLSKVDANVAYFNNMALSQARTRSVLEYCHAILGNSDYQQFIRQYVTANGLSSSKLILDAAGEEDKVLSRRVTFRAKTNSEKHIVRILDEMKHD